MWDELSPVEWKQKLLTALNIQEQEDDVIKERHEMDEVARATEVVGGKRKKVQYLAAAVWSQFRDTEDLGKKK